MQFSSESNLSEAPARERLQGDDRYAANWSATSKRARNICPVCCWCQNAPATETHHATYWDKGAIAGREIPGIHVFPVCGNCHDKLHSGERWFSPRDHLARRNTPSAIAKLRDGWTILTTSGNF